MEYYLATLTFHLDEKEFKEMVCAVRTAEKMIGKATFDIQTKLGGKEIFPDPFMLQRILKKVIELIR